MEKKFRHCVKSSKSNISLRFHLVRFLVIFLAIVIFITWLFQVGLLDVLYENVRKRDMEQSAEDIVKQIDSEDLSKAVYTASMDNIIGVIVYQINGNQAVRIASEVPTADEETAALFFPKELSRLYGDAKNAGGSFHTKLTFGGKEVQIGFFQRLFPWIFGKADSYVSEEMIHLVHVRLCEGADGTEYMLLLNTELEPMTPLVHILQRQFIWIFAILVLLSLLFVIPMSRRIVRPLVQMNQAAKQLANGNYDADFGVDRGYKETKELAQTLTFAAQELSKSDCMQKELTANISHDLRTPLTMIRGYAEVMRDIPEENTPENLQILIDETEHLTELVNDLMDLSKIQSGVRAPVMEFFDLTSVLSEVMARYEAFTKAQGYRITLEADVNVPVFADRGMILQAVYNLVNNAINYTGEDLCVTVKQSIMGDRVRISVKDTGEGIPEDQLALIWDRYYKVDKVHRIAKVGTGLGLSIVKGVLEVHNAAYGVESKLGEGSVFWFELPISAPPETFEG